MRFFVSVILPAMILISCDSGEKIQGLEQMLKSKPHEVIGYTIIPEDECTSAVDLIAGQHYKAGMVMVRSTSEENGNPCFKVQFVTENSWILTEVHVDVQTDPSMFPVTKSGNPIVGHFAYSEMFTSSDAITDFETPCIALPSVDSDFDCPVYVAVHAVVCGGIIGYKEKKPDFEAFAEYLPATGSLTVSHPGESSYFDALISGTGTFFDEMTYESWCLNLNRYIFSGVTYTVEFLPGLEENNLVGVIDKPENINLVNYLLNQDYSHLGGFTENDIQVSIWNLVEKEDDLEIIPLPYNEEVVSHILEDVYAYGAGFTPGCGDYAAVILIPKDSEGSIVAQVTMIPVLIPCTPVCGGCETAWGSGTGFPGNSWAMYFRYCTQ